MHSPRPVDPVRLNVLVAGYPWKPFSIKLVTPETATLGDLSICSAICEQVVFHQVFLQPRDPRSLNVDPRYCYLRFYVALSKAHDRRFLRLYDDHTMKLIASRAFESLYRAYMSPDCEIDRHAPILPLLASLAGRDPRSWHPQPDEIHIIVGIACHGKLYLHGDAWTCRNDVALARGEYYEWPARPDLVACCGSCFDLEFRSKSWTSWELMFELLSQAHEPAGLPPLPPFGWLSICRRRCGIATTVPNSLVDQDSSPVCPSVPSLCKLAADATLPNLLRSDPGYFVDAVDCVVDGVLESMTTQTKAICYLKFVPGEGVRPIEPKYLKRGPLVPPLTEVYVNPEMLELLDWVVATGDRDDLGEPQDPPLRLLLFVTRTHFFPSIDAACLPPNMHAIAVSYRF